MIVSFAICTTIIELQNCASFVTKIDIKYCDRLQCDTTIDINISKICISIIENMTEIVGSLSGAIPHHLQ